MVSYKPSRHRGVGFRFLLLSVSFAGGGDRT
jgi:hypothetical protein